MAVEVGLEDEQREGRLGERLVTERIGHAALAIKHDHVEGHQPHMHCKLSHGRASGVMPSPPRDAAGASRVCMSYVRSRPTASCEGSTWSLVPIVPRNTPTRHACARRLARRAL